MSDNQFIPQFDVVGPVTVSKNSAYYGKNESGDGSDTNFPQMIKEACQQVDGKVNFADYDSDGDGYVDLVYVMPAILKASQAIQAIVSGQNRVP